MIGVGVDSIETGIMTAGGSTMVGADASFAVIAAFAVTMSFAMATSSMAIVVPAEIVRADTAGADKAIGNPSGNQT